MKKLMVLDSNSIVNRAFYGVSQNLTTRAGQPTNAIFGFLNILTKLLDEGEPDALCVTFDRKAPTFRHLAYEGYKATRKGMPDELASQLPLLKDVLAAMNIPMYELDGWEADDLIGTISAKDTAAGWETVIVTGDKDSLQLVTDTTTVKLVSTRMGRTTTRDMTPEVFREEYGFDPIHIIDLKALMGDSSDNIPGVKGVGEKTAMALVQRYGSIDDLYAALPEVEMAPGTPAKPGVIKKLTEGEDQARMSYDLATIHTDAPIDFAPENNLRKEPNGPALYQLFLDLEFAKLIDKFHLTAPQGEGAVQEEAAAQVNTASEVVETRERLEELLALWRTLDEVNVLALPTLDGVCVEWQVSEREHRAALLFADKLEGYNGGLKTLFGPEIKKTVHGSKELWKRLLDEGISPGGFVFDTEVAAYLLAPTDGSYDLEKLGLTYYNQEFPKAKTYLEEGAFGPLADPAAPAAALLSHTALIGALRKTLSQRLEELGLNKIYDEVDLPLCPVLAEMEEIGVLVDRGALVEFGEMLSQGIDKVQAAIYELAGEEFNINSTQQLGRILFDQLGLPPVKKTKTGYSTSVDVLEKVKNEHPIIGDILEYRQLTKLNSTYAVGLVNYISDDGRIHGTFNQTITATGRISSTEPNLQNIPMKLELGRLIRKAFIPKEGYIFVDADYSQVELRVLAHLSGDEVMKNAFLNNVDIHATTASEVFEVPIGEVTPLQRRHAKAVNFGIVYGISAFGLSEDLGISRKEASDFIAKYYDTYKSIKAYLDEQVAHAKEKGYVTTMFGRIRPIPELKSSNFMQRSFGERVAMNSPIQGTAADIIKIAMVRVNMKLKELGLKSQLILQIHDELLIEAAEDEVDIVKKLLVDEMMHAADMTVPLEVGVASGNNWYEAK